MRTWPAQLIPYKQTREFDAESTPEGLRSVHRTKPGVWARLHVAEGALAFHDHVTGEVLVLGPGAHPLIFPEQPHHVALLGPVRFWVEFCSLPPEG